MAIDIPLSNGLSLKIDDAGSVKNNYPTSNLQKGFLLIDNGKDLTEEAVGFGIPMLKNGLQTIFPGSVSLEWKQNETLVDITALYKLNLIEKISIQGNESLKGRLLYTTKNILAAGIRQFPLLRNLLTTTSNWLRQVFRWETTYGDAGLKIELKVTYSVEGETGRIFVEMDASNLPSCISEVVIMNELGANHFDVYKDTSGVSLHNEAIGCWDKVIASDACFESSIHHVAFRLGQVKGAQLFRGRELVGNRLNWAGFGYSFPPSIKFFRYIVEIERIK